MSSSSLEVKRSVVKIRVLKTGKHSWYRDKEGQVVESIREITTDNEGAEWVSYKQYPAPKGFEPSGHYVGYEIEEVGEQL